MFTGIVETTGKVEKIEKSGTNYTFTIESAISPELKIDQSVSHNGVCLTVIGVAGAMHQVTAIHETMEKTSLGLLVGSMAISYKGMLIRLAFV